MSNSLRQLTLRFLPLLVALLLWPTIAQANAPENITLTQLSSYLTLTSGVVLIDYSSATGCSSCDTFDHSLVLLKAAQKYTPDSPVHIVKLLVDSPTSDDAVTLKKDDGVSSFPTLKVYVNGTETKTLPLNVSVSTIDSTLDSYAAKIPKTPTGAVAPPPSQKCTQGVLINDPGANCLTFSQYIQKFINQAFPLIFFVAVIMITFSGVQYMLGGLTPEGMKAARQRIVGILGGAIFFVLIGMILRLLAPYISLNSIQPDNNSTTQTGT